MHTAILPRLACPSCQGKLQLSQEITANSSFTLVWEGVLSCQVCHARYPITNGIPRLIRKERSSEIASFLQAYNRLRKKEGWAVEEEEYYRKLPYEDITGKHSKEWKIRAYSFGRFLAKLKQFAKGRSLSIVDLGAGTGWLAARLCEIGHRTIAIDLDPDSHGLGAAKYLRGDSPEFAWVQGEIQSVPLAVAQIDLIVLNASLHYVSDYSKTLQALKKNLSPKGALVILDSPMYETQKEAAYASLATSKYYLSQQEPFLAQIGYQGLVQKELLNTLSSFASVKIEITHTPTRFRKILLKMMRGYRPAYFAMVWASLS